MPCSSGSPSSCATTPRDGGTVAVFFDEAQALQESTLPALPRLLDLASISGASRPAARALRTAGARRAPRGTGARGAAHAGRGHGAAGSALSGRRRGLVRARLVHARGADPDLFEPAALERLALLSQGVPRVINVLCESALVAAFAEGQPRITASVIDAVWADYAPLHAPVATPMPAPPPDPVGAGPAPETGGAPGRSSSRIVLALAAVAGLGLVSVLAARPWRSPPPPAVAPETPPSTASSPIAQQTPPSTVPVAPSEAEVASGPEAANEVPPRPTPPSAAEAIALVDRFWEAYAARDSNSLQALFAPEAAPAGRVLDVDPTGGGALVTPAARIEAKPMGDRVAVRVPFLLATRDDRGRTVRRQGVASLQIAMRDGSPRIVELSAESGAVPR